MEKDIQKAIETLKAGGIILYPTDTIWGIGCDAVNTEAVEKLFRLKRRPEAKAMISLVDSEKTLERYVEYVPRRAKEEMEHCDRPITIIYENARGISPLLIAEDGSAAFRIPRLEYTRELCRRLGRPLVSTSANLAGEKTATTFAEIGDEIKGGVDYICKYDNQKTDSKPSRIVKISGNGEAVIIRE